MPYAVGQLYAAEVCAEWESLSENGTQIYRPVIEGIFVTAGVGWSNLRDTGQVVPPDPNLCCWLVDQVDGAGLNAVEADGRCLIVWASQL